MKGPTFQFLTETLDSPEFHIQPLAGDASTRRYYRIVVEQSSTVLMEWDPFESLEKYPFLNVQRYFDHVGVNVPKVIGASAELGLVLLEDLGDLTLERRFEETQNKNLSAPFYEQSIQELIKIQYTATDKRGSCVAFDVEFDTDKFMWEMNYAKKHLITTLSNLDMSPKVEQEFDRILMDICQKLDALPKRLCHRDYHSRNLMIKLNSIRVIDFQDARMGPVVYDLVSLLRDSYVNMPESLEENLLEYYAETCRSLGDKVLIDDEFWQNYELQTIQRAFKACGSFSSFKNTRGDERYLKYIPKTVKTVLDSLDKFPEYKLMSDLLIECDLLT